MLGVGTAWPYGCTYRPVSCEWMYRMFGRFIRSSLQLIPFEG